MSKFGFITAKQAIAQIRRALKLRSDRRWSVTNSRGTGYGWIRIVAPPSRGGPNDMSDTDQEELCRLFDLQRNRVGRQGFTIQPTEDFYHEYIDRSEGREPMIRGQIDLYAR